MRRYVLLNTVLIVAWIQGLHYAHAIALTSDTYDLYRSGRWMWSFVLSLAISLAAYIGGLPETATSRRDAAKRMALAIGAGIGLVSLAQLGLGSALLPRAVVGLTPLTLVPWTLIAWNLTSDDAQRKASSDRVLAVVEADLAGDLRTEVSFSRTSQVTLVAALPSTELAGQDTDQPLVELARVTRATIIVLDGIAQATPAIVRQAAILHEDGVRIRTLSMFYEQWLGKLPLADLERVSLMFDIQEVHRTLYGRAKRLADSMVALLLLPVLAVVGVAVVAANLLGDRGPVLYRQQRVGKDGAVFEILKFRTMTVGSASGDRDEWTTEDDARITGIGRILRRSHLDELPQIVNIFRGELSIVGPRPEQVAYVEELSSKLEFYPLRHLVRPGLTGWAQVNMGYVASEADAFQKLQYDFYYLRHQSLWCDLQVLARTARGAVLLGGR